MRPITLFLTTLLILGLQTGCQSTKIASAPGAGASAQNNGYSLLHQLLDQQKDVSLLRFIKAEQPDVKSLVKKIATTSGTGAKLLEKFAHDTPAIRLDDFRLPPAEQATRASIAAAKQKELLGQKGDTFELTLLLTQTEALSYAAHLAKVTGESEPDPGRARALAGISADMESLYHDVFALLLGKLKPTTVK